MLVFGSLFVCLLWWLPLVATGTEEVEGPRFIAEVSGLLMPSGLPCPEGDTPGVYVWGQGAQVLTSRQGSGQWLLAPSPYRAWHCPTFSLSLQAGIPGYWQKSLSSNPSLVLN